MTREWFWNDGFAVEINNTNVCLRRILFSQSVIDSANGDIPQVPVPSWNHIWMKGREATLVTVFCVYQTSRFSSIDPNNVIHFLYDNYDQSVINEFFFVCQKVEKLRLLIITYLQKRQSTSTSFKNDGSAWERQCSKITTSTRLPVHLSKPIVCFLPLKLTLASVDDVHASQVSYQEALQMTFIDASLHLTFFSLFCFHNRRNHFARSPRTKITYH